MENKKRIFFNILFNIIATVIPLFVLQILIYPNISKKIGDDSYGLMLTLVSVLTVVGSSMGNSLNNIHLIKRKEYEQKGYDGDFPIILLVEIIITSLAALISGYTYGVRNIQLVLFVLTATAWTFREYAIVYFLIAFDYSKVLVNNVLLIIGYLIGYLIFYYTGEWMSVYLIGLICSIIHIVIYTHSFERVSLKSTPILLSTIRELIILLVASVIINLMNYADRMLIYPMMGGVAVSCYYVSTLFGKIVSAGISPITNVLLSYLSRKSELKKENIRIMMSVAFVLAIVGYFFCIIISKPLLTFLYPKLVDEAIRYTFIMTAVAMISMIIKIATPYILKFCEMKWQIIINGIVFIIYLVASVVLFKLYGLMGFCVGVLLSYLVKMIIMILLLKKVSV